ncbi:MAG TPA: Crp/Fnr family transcriptional regulator [Cytophagaceae bacterium]|jgi:CRP-like cAMP-binding protein|nr:Crp/Fnr family transcriptional regulator [Cytophagaceae bacterium]
MTDFQHFCHHFSPLDKEAANELFKDVKTKSFKKGEYIVKSGQVCKHLFFLNEGLVKICFVKEDKQFVMRFFSEQRLFTVFDSYLTQMPSEFMLVALEPTIVTMVSYEKMEVLCKKYHCMETFFRKLVSITPVRMMKRISEMLEENAAERYTLFVKEYSSILQRISLGDIANYLGITQQSLSRIRSKK